MEDQRKNLIFEFESLDKDRDGFLSLDELHSGLLERQWSQDAVQDLFVKLDSNKDGRVSLEEYLEFYVPKQATSHSIDQSSSRAEFITDVVMGELKRSLDANPAAEGRVSGQSLQDCLKLAGGKTDLQHKLFLANARSENSEFAELKQKLDTYPAALQSVRPELSKLLDSILRSQYKKLFENIDLASLMVDQAMKQPHGLEGLPISEAFDLRKHFSETELVEMIKDLAPYAARRGADLLEDMQKMERVLEEEGKFNNDLILSSPGLFDKGLNNVLGLPNPRVLEIMEIEHNSDEKFVAFNDGVKRTTTAKAEFQRILPDGVNGDISRKDFYGADMCSVPWMQHPLVQKARLTKAEVVALRAYTGPLYKQYNSVLRHLSKSINEKLERSGDLDASVETAKAEFIGTFTTTIHALTSAIIKVRKISQTPKDGRVYRAISNNGPPKTFFEGTTRGGLEVAFMSTSMDKEAAIGYARKSATIPMLFEILVDSINKGADIAFLSLFPREAEMLMPPLTNMEICGPSRLETFDNKVILVWPLMVSINMKSLTMEELEASRKQLHLSMIDNLIAEAARDFQRIQAVFEDHQSEQVLIELKSVLNAHKEVSHVSYNNDFLYKKQVDVALRAKTNAVVKVLVLISKQLENAGDPQELKQVGLEEMWDRINPFQLFKVEKDQDSIFDIATKVGIEAEELLQPILREAGERPQSNGMAPLLNAAEEGNLELVRALTKAGVELETRNTLKDTALILACRRGHAEVVQVLVDAKADVNAKGERDEIPLVAAAANAGVEVTRALLSGNPNVNSCDAEGMSPLMFASLTGRDEVVKALLAAGADITLRDRDKGSTAMIWAATYGHNAVIQLLIDANADVNCADNHNMKPAYFAKYFAKKQDTLDLLLSYGATGI